jgi:hypothetical protein
MIFFPFDIKSVRSDHHLILSAEIITEFNKTVKTSPIRKAPKAVLSSYILLLTHITLRLYCTIGVLSGGESGSNARIPAKGVLKHLVAPRSGGTG